MDISSKIQFAIGSVASLAVTGAWWYAALRKRGVALFYWLAVAHTLSTGLHLLTVIYLFTGATGRIFAMGSIQTLMTVVLAGLYLTLARWLVQQP